MPILDTQKVTDDLVAAGLPQPQARAVSAKLEEAAQAARGNLATEGHLEAVRADLHGALEQSKIEMNVRFAEADAKVSERMRTQFVALVAAMAGVAGVTLAVARLLG